VDQILFIVLNMGQSTALFRTYFHHEDQVSRDTVLTTSLWLIVTLSLPMGLLALVLSRPIGVLLTGSSSYTVWVALGIGAMIFKAVLRLPLAVLRAREQSRLYALASSGRTLVGIVLAIVFVVGLHWGGRGVLMSQLLAELLLLAVLLPVSLRRLPLRFSGRDARDLLGYGLYLVPTGLLGFFLHLSDRFFLKHFASLSAVGIYALGCRFGEIVTFAILAIRLAWPQFMFANQKAPDAPRLYARVFTYTAAALGGLWLVVSLLAEELVTIMAHATFRDAYHVVPLVAAAFALEGLGTVGNVGMPLYRKVQYRPAMIAALAALNVGLNYLFVPRYGPIGAALALFVSMGAKCLLELAIGYMLYPVPYEYTRLARMAAVGAVVYAVGISVPWGSLWVSVLAKAALIATTPLWLYAIGFFGEDERRRIRGALDRARRWPRALPEAPGGGS
jgi:O-antigen/teichoic acid export membrane protein